MTMKKLLFILSLVRSTASLLPHGHFEQQRAQAAQLERHGNVDVDQDGLSYCHLAGYLAFSRAADNECNLAQAEKIYKELAAIYMAIHHFNNGDGTVVPEIQGINERCSIKLSAELVDSKYTPAVFVQSLTEIVGSRQISTPEAPLPCAVVGARTSSATAPGAVVSGVYDLPHMSYTATSPELNDPFRYPSFSRVVTSDDAAAKAAMKFLTGVLGSSHVAVLYINDPFGNEYNKAFRQEALENNVTALSLPLEFPPDDGNIQTAISVVKRSGYKHVFLITFSSYIEQVMLEAQAQGATGPDFFYLLGISTSFFEDAEYSPEQAKAFTGMGILPEFGAKPRSSGYDRFVQAWNLLGEDDIDYFNTKLPIIAGEAGSECFQGNAGFFSEKYLDSPGDTAPFAYDTVMAMGLGACEALSEETLVGSEHAAAIVEHAQFDGATGYIQMDPETRARDPLSFSYAVLNVREEPNEEGFVKFTTPESYLIQPDEKQENWILKQTDEFIFNDGSTTPPPPLPVLDVDYSYLGKWRILGFSLCATVMLFSAGCASWSWVYRKDKAVSMSQPFFLLMISGGTALMASTLIALSFADDEHVGQAGADAACMAQPWLASMGFVIVFAALYSKTSRINQIMHNAHRFRSVKVSVVDVLVPFCAMLFSNLVVLICWTAIDPVKFVRTLDPESDRWDRAVSSTGRCQSSADSGAVSYLVCLAAINLGAVALANIQAYKGRNIADDLSESKYIGLIMMCLLQTCLTGIPVLFLVYKDPIYNYVVVCMICFLTCMAILSLTFIPKIMLWRHWSSPGAMPRNAATNDRRAGSTILRGGPTISGVSMDFRAGPRMSTDLRAAPRYTTSSKDDISEDSPSQTQPSNVQPPMSSTELPTCTSLSEDRPGGDIESPSLGGENSVGSSNPPSTDPPPNGLVGSLSNLAFADT